MYSCCTYSLVRHVPQGLVERWLASFTKHDISSNKLMYRLNMNLCVILSAILDILMLGYHQTTLYMCLLISPTISFPFCYWLVLVLWYYYGKVHAIATVEDAVELLLADNRSANKFTFIALLAKLVTMVETNNSDLAKLIPHVNRIVIIMQRHVDNSDLVRNGMTLIRVICSTGDGKRAMTPVTSEVMTILHTRRKCTKVIHTYILFILHKI